MCRRFALKATPSEIAALLGLDTVANLAPRYNIAPTQEVLALRGDGAGGHATAWLFG